MTGPKQYTSEFKRIREQKRKELFTKSSRKILENISQDEEKKLTLQDKRRLGSPFFWYMLAVTRVYLSLTQTGYIHPDEFHQSLQVIAYDLLEIDGLKPWEYSSSSPIRSVAFSGIVSLPIVTIKSISPFIKYAFGIELMTPQMLIVFPRFFMALLSFISDFCVFKIASMCYVRPWQCVEVFAGSYIMLIYSTRTFSNCIELILFSLLLWRVCLSVVESFKIIRKENVLQDLYDTADSMKDKVKIARMKSKLPFHNYVDSLAISVIVTFGVFVRPTFIVFAFVPVFYWLQRGVVTKEVDFSVFHWRCVSLLPGTFVTFTICMLADSFYYNSISLVEFLRGNITVASFTLTPVNFLLYNSKVGNLAEHGLHPYFLHIAVNIPLLHGVLGFAGLWSVSKYFAHLIFRKMATKPKIFGMAPLLLFSFIVPVLALSVIPHQEPRFLLPTLVPLILLHSDKISIYALPSFKFTKHFLFLLWQVWNIICVVFFGFLHQGGVTKTMVYVHDYVASQHHSLKFQIFFSHMYSPPTFLLMRKIPVIATTDEGRRFLVERTVTTHDLGSSLTPEEVFEDIINLGKKSTPKPEIILCVSATLSTALREAKPDNITLALLRNVPGHISIETFPDFNIDEMDITVECNKACLIAKKVKELSIDVFNIKLQNTNSEYIIKDRKNIIKTHLSHEEL